MLKQVLLIYKYLLLFYKRITKKMNNINGILFKKQTKTV